MSKTVVVMSCAHVKPDVPNDRFIWLGKFLYDLRPDEFINLGDFSELESLSSFDSKYPKKLVARSYEADVNHTRDAHEKMWHLFRKNNRRMPFKVFLQGNHEYRLDRAIQHDPGLGGEVYGISWNHLSILDHYHEYVPYTNQAPGMYMRDGVVYSHFITSGSYGTAMGGVNHGIKLIEKMGCSTTVGHSHYFNYYVKEGTIPRPQQGLSVGCFLGGDHEWAGQTNNDWSKGVVVKHNLENGSYDLQWVSLKTIEKLYS